MRVRLTRPARAVQLWGCASADVYLHAPRGSNNRLNEQNVNRDNNNRLFNSQNNNKGGYSVGIDADDYDNANIPRPEVAAGFPQVPLAVAEGSEMPIEWTPQHACGPNAKVKCDMIIQWLDDSATTAGATGDGADFPGTATQVAGNVRLRDGTQTGCQDNNDQCPPLANDNAETNDTNDPQYGNHEPVQWYLDCRQRAQNEGLYTADQNLDGDEARFTRQNPGGGRSGTECAEERDYYPYWHPSPFKDIAVLTSDLTKCPMYQAESQNVMNKGLCTAASENNAADCQAAGGTWQDKGAWGLAPPDCQEMYWTRDNHLGNAENGYAPVYNWSLPKVTGTGASRGTDTDVVVIRVRYNITTEDTGTAVDASGAPVAEFDDLDANSNGNASPVQQDEGTLIGNADVPGGTDQNGDPRTQQLALNTNQYGRTFEDRSYAVTLENEVAQINRRRMQAAPAATEPGDCSEIHELHLRGKRGNIVQSYPSVEHDFLPTVLIADVGDCIRFQVQLSDNDPPNNAGEGLPGSGRGNLALQSMGDKNIPLGSFGEQNFFNTVDEMFNYAYLNQEGLRRTNGADTCLREDQIDNNNNEQNVRNCGKLNPIGPSADGGLVKLRNAGHWAYMSTRENNFSNRSHKGQIIVTEKISNTEVIILAILAVVIFTAMVGTLFGAWTRGKLPGFANYQGASDGKPPAGAGAGPPRGAPRGAPPPRGPPPRGPGPRGPPPRGPGPPRRP